MLHNIVFIDCIFNTGEGSLIKNAVKTEVTWKLSKAVLILKQLKLYLYISPLCPCKV